MDRCAVAAPPDRVSPAGRGSIEADYPNGEIVLLGRLHGVPTPVNAALQQLANEVARAGDPPESFPVAERLERIAEAQTRVAGA